MNLCIDIGNTRIKAGVFKENELVFFGNYSHQETGLLQSELEGIFSSGQLKYCGIISVGKSTLMENLASMFQFMPPGSLLEIDYKTPLPVANAYSSPETLGIDRIVAVVGALAQCEGPLLVIDPGTALTYEYADTEGVYQGGGIAPGIRLRFKALNDYTANLPNLQPENDFPLVGKTTHQSILSGVLNGIIAEIEGTISRYQSLAGPDLKVFLTGGDAEFLGNHLKNINFVDSNLILKGINRILQYNQPHA